MARSARQYCCLVAIPIWVIVSLLVIFAPQLFYTDVNDIAVSKRTGRQNALISLRSKYNKAGFDNDLKVLNKDIARSKAELKDLTSQKPYWGKPKPQLQNAIAMSNHRLDELYQAGKSLQLERDTALTQIRALTPVFSKMAFDETRELFKKRQEEYAGVFCWFWKWDMMMSMMFRMPMGGRDGGMGEAIMRAILDLMYKLTVGTLVACGDFACRLPFWLKEYQIFTYDDFPHEDFTRPHSDRYVSDSPKDTAEKDMDADLDKDDAYERLQREHDGENFEDETDLDEQESSAQSGRSSRGKKFEEEDEDFDFETVPVVGSSGGWIPTLYSFFFWVMAMCAASGATLGLILLIWSPLIALVIFAAIKNRGREPGQRRSNYQFRQRQHYD